LPAALVCVLAATTSPTEALLVAMAGPAACGVAARAVIGHLPESTVGAVTVAVHTLAAAVWRGALPALAATITGRAHC
jgi:copper resistance protein D